MTIGEDGDKYWLKHWDFYFSRYLPIQDDWIVQILNYSTCFARSNIQFLVLPFITREYDPKILEPLHLIQWYFANLHRTFDKIF